VPWQDLDLEDGTLAETGSMKRVLREVGSGYEVKPGPATKSAGGRRTIQLPPIPWGDRHRSLAPSQARRSSSESMCGLYLRASSAVRRLMYQGMTRTGRGAGTGIV
jgi:hypothetical protein